MDKEYWNFTTQTILVLIIALFVETRALGKGWFSRRLDIRILVGILYAWTIISSILAIYYALAFFSGSTPPDVGKFFATNSILGLLVLVLGYPLADLVLNLLAVALAWIVSIHPTPRIKLWRLKRKAKSAHEDITHLTDQARFSRIRARAIVSTLYYYEIRLLRHEAVRRDPDFYDWLAHRMESFPLPSFISLSGDPNLLNSIRHVRIEMEKYTDQLDIEIRLLRERSRDAKENLQRLTKQIEEERVSRRRDLIKRVDGIEFTPVPFIRREDEG